MDETTPSTSPAPQKSGGSGKAIGIIILVIVLALLAWYFTKNNNGSQSVSNSQTTTSTEQSAGQPTSLKNLMAGSPQKCDVSFSNGTNQTQGTVYVNHSSYRGDFNYQTPDGKITTTHMISDGQTVWTWQDGTGVGYRMSTGVMGESASTTPGSGSGVDPAANYNYQCSSWNVVNSMFTPPSDYKFTDMSASMNTGASASSSSSSTKAQQCAACGSLTGSQQAQCKAALSCP
jgi:hypothetical protein